MCFGIDELRILAVEGIGLPHGALAEPLRMSTQLFAEHRRQAGAVGHVATGTLGQHAFNHGIVAGKGGAQISRHLARLGVGLAGHGLARCADQTGAGLPVDQERGQAEAQQRDHSGAQHQLVGDAARAMGSGGAGRGHGRVRKAIQDDRRHEDTAQARDPSRRPPAAGPRPVHEAHRI
ncbi:hypothetical protein SMG44B_20454 [Stenotrophomonas maltophilia]